MNIVDGIGFQREFDESPTLVNYRKVHGGRVSQIRGYIPQLSVTNDDLITVYDFGTITIDGGILHAYGKGTVYASGTAKVYAHDEVRVLAFDDAEVRAYQQASVICNNKSSAVGFERSHLTLNDRSFGELRDISVGSFHNFSQGTIFDSARANAYDATIVEIYGDHASLRARGRSAVGVHGTPALWLGGSAIAHVEESTKSQFIIISEKASITQEPLNNPSKTELKVSDTPTLGYQKGGSPAEDHATVQAAAPLPAAQTNPAPATEAVPEPAVPAQAPVWVEPENTAPPTPPAVEDTAAPEEPTYASTLTLPTGTPLPQFGDAWTALKTSL